MARQFAKFHIVKTGIWLLVGAFVAAMLLGSTSGQPAAAAPLAAPTWTSCTPTQVMAYPERVHIRCASAVGGISFFAVGTANAPNAARMLSVLTTAQVAGRTLTILYDPADLSGASIGCRNADCRLIQAVGFGQ